MAIDDGTEIPDNSIAHVYDLSAVGEQYVDLVPPHPSPANLHDGSVIPPEHTTTPLETATVLYDLQRFVCSINPPTLQIWREGALAFKGTGPQLKRSSPTRRRSSTSSPRREDTMPHLLDNSAILLHAPRATPATSTASPVARQLTARSPTRRPTIDTFLRQAPTTPAS